jgi:hypothetical protein
MTSKQDDHITDILFNLSPEELEREIAHLSPEELAELRDQAVALANRQLAIATYAGNAASKEHKCE